MQGSVRELLGAAVERLYPGEVSDRLFLLPHFEQRLVQPTRELRRASALHSPGTPQGQVRALRSVLHTPLHGEFLSNFNIKLTKENPLK